MKNIRDTIMRFIYANIRVTKITILIIRKKFIM